MVKTINMDWEKPILEEIRLYRENRLVVTEDTIAKGNMLYHTNLKQINRFLSRDPSFDMVESKGFSLEDVLNRYITKDVCKYISCEFILYFLDDYYPLKNIVGNYVKKLYMRNLCLSDKKTMEIFEKYKIHNISMGCPPGVTMEDRWSFRQRKKREKQQAIAKYKKEQREKRKLAHLQHLYDTTPH